MGNGLVRVRILKRVNTLIPHDAQYPIDLSQYEDGWVDQLILDTEMEPDCTIEAISQRLRDDGLDEDFELGVKDNYSPENYIGRDYVDFNDTIKSLAAKGRQAVLYVLPPRPPQGNVLVRGIDGELIGLDVQGYKQVTIDQVCEMIADKLSVSKSRIQLELQDTTISSESTLQQVNMQYGLVLDCVLLPITTQLSESQERINRNLRVLS